MPVGPRPLREVVQQVLDILAQVQKGLNEPWGVKLTPTDQQVLAHLVFRITARLVKGHHRHIGVATLARDRGVSRARIKQHLGAIYASFHLCSEREVHMLAAFILALLTRGWNPPAIVELLCFLLSGGYPVAIASGDSQAIPR